MTPDERRKALETEFERLKERADWLDRMHQGHPDAWAGIQALIPDGTELVIDKLVTEARQNATAMATIAKTLAALGEEKPEAKANPLDEIARKRKERERAAGS